MAKTSPVIRECLPLPQKLQYMTRFDGLIVHKTAHPRAATTTPRYTSSNTPRSRPVSPAEMGTQKTGLGGDTTYREMAGVVEGIDARLPAMRKPGKDLTAAQREYNEPALENPHTRRERHPEDQDLPDCQGKIQEQPRQIRPYQRYRLRGGQPDHPAEESRGPLRRAAASRPGAGAA